MNLVLCRKVRMIGTIGTVDMIGTIGTIGADLHNRYTYNWYGYPGHEFDYIIDKFRLRFESEIIHDEEDKIQKLLEIYHAFHEENVNEIDDTLYRFYYNLIICVLLSIS